MLQAGQQVRLALEGFGGFRQFCRLEAALHHLFDGDHPVAQAGILGAIHRAKTARAEPRQEVIASFEVWLCRQISGQVLCLREGLAASKAGGRIIWIGCATVGTVTCRGVHRLADSLHRCSVRLPGWDNVTARGTMRRLSGVNASSRSGKLKCWLLSYNTS